MSSTPKCRAAPPLARLIRLLVALQSGRFPNAVDLAEIGEVSRRTIYRDLEALERAGVPIRYRPDRQGYDLAPGFLFQAPGLVEGEAMALAILARVVRDDGGLGLRRLAESGVQKLLAALPAESRRKVAAVSELVAAGDEEGRPAREGNPASERILEALAARRQLRLWYHAPDDREVQCTKVSPYRLVVQAPTWILVGRSTVHRKVAAFPLDAIERMELTDDPAAIPPRFRLDRHLEPDPAESPDVVGPAATRGTPDDRADRPSAQCPIVESA